VEDADIFLHNLAVTLALEAENACKEEELDLTGDGVILHLGQSFMLSLKHVIEARRPIKLPEFKGYTVDQRLKEFRKAEYGKSIEFISFDSLKGQQLLEEMRASGR